MAKLPAWPTDLAVGDIVTAYHKGYHRITKIERRFYTKGEPKSDGKKVGDEYSPLICYDYILNSEYKPRKGNNCCDSQFVRKMTKERLHAEWMAAAKKLQEGQAKLMEILEQ
jgi:hypothetical protein